MVGLVQSLHSTLAVRLGHCGLSTTARAEMWRNAAVFTAKAGGKCGLSEREVESFFLRACEGGKGARIGEEA